MELISQLHPAEEVLRTGRLENVPDAEVGQ
jgi:hypothetical protein